jgi:hypothetical protein
VRPAVKQDSATQSICSTTSTNFFEFKACMVAGGYRQQPGVDFKDTSAAVCSNRSVRIMLAVAAHENLEM